MLVEPLSTCRLQAVLDQIERTRHWDTAAGVKAPSDALQAACDGAAAWQRAASESWQTVGGGGGRRRPLSAASAAASGGGDEEGEADPEDDDMVGFGTRYLA